MRLPLDSSQSTKINGWASCSSCFFSAYVRERERAKARQIPVDYSILMTRTRVDTGGGNTSRYINGILRNWWAELEDERRKNFTEWKIARHNENALAHRRKSDWGGVRRSLPIIPHTHVSQFNPIDVSTSRADDLYTQTAPARPPFSSLFILMYDKRM